jgi:hypothetical protein
MIDRNKIHRLKQQPRHGRGLLDDLSNLGGVTAAAGTSAAKLLETYASLNRETNNLVTGFEKQQAVNQALISDFEAAAKASLYLELRNKDLQKAFGTNSIIAAKLSENIQKIATKFGYAGKEAQKYAMAVKNIAPTLDQINVENQNYLDGLMGVQRVLTTNLGLSEDQAASYTGLATQNGKNAVEMLKSTQQLADFLDPSGGMGYFKMITEGLAETTEDLQLQYGKIPNNLALATLRAKSLGLSIEQITSAGESLLDIESSIGSELEYQLLSGRRLVDQQGKSLTNTFREATLRGDAAEQANTLNKILEQEGETLENNLFARKQMATLLGMDEASLSRALQKKKLLEESGAEVLFDLEGDELKKAAESMVANGAIAEDTFNKIVELSDTRTTDEKMVEQLTAVAENTSVLKSGQAAAVGQVQANLAASVAGPMKDVMINLTDDVSKTLGESITAIKSALAVTDIKSMIMDLFVSSQTPEMTSVVTTNDDAVIPAGYGSRILSFPEDTLQAPIAFSDKDTIVAGTNLSGAGGGGGMSRDSAVMIVAAIERQTAALRAGLFQERGINTPIY